MVMGKNIRVSGPVDRSTGYHLLVEQRGNTEGLMVFSNNTMDVVRCEELQTARGEQQYEAVCEGYALLGNLTHGLEHTMLVVTGIVSVGRLGQSEVYRVTQVRRQFQHLNDDDDNDDEEEEVEDDNEDDDDEEEDDEDEDEE